MPSHTLPDVGLSDAVRIGDPAGLVGAVQFEPPGAVASQPPAWGFPATPGGNKPNFAFHATERLLVPGGTPFL